MPTPLSLAHTYQSLSDHVGMFQKTSLVIAVILGGSGSMEEAFCDQPIDHFQRNDGSAVRQLHKVQEGINLLSDLVSHGNPSQNTSHTLPEGSHRH